MEASHAEKVATFESEDISMTDQSQNAAKTKGHKVEQTMNTLNSVPSIVHLINEVIGEEDLELSERKQMP